MEITLKYVREEEWVGDDVTGPDLTKVQDPLEESSTQSKK